MCLLRSWTNNPKCIALCRVFRKGLFLILKYNYVTINICFYYTSCNFNFRKVCLTANSFHIFHDSLYEFRQNWRSQNRILTFYFIFFQTFLKLILTFSKMTSKLRKINSLSSLILKIVHQFLK